MPDREEEFGEIVRGYVEDALAGLKEHVEDSKIQEDAKEILRYLRHVLQAEDGAEANQQRLLLRASAKAIVVEGYVTVAAEAQEVAKKIVREAINFARKVAARLLAGGL